MENLLLYPQTLNQFIPFLLYFLHLFYLAASHVESVELLRISFSQLRLTWQAPKDLNGITGFNVTWKMVSNDKQQSVNGFLNQMSLPKENTSYVINNLGKRCKL